MREALAGARKARDRSLFWRVDSDTYKNFVEFTVKAK